MIKRGMILLVLLLGLAVLLAGCGGKEPAKTSTGEKVIKIGFIGPLTGDVQTFGESTKNGFLLALEKAGFKAGDYKLEYVVADDRNDPNEAVNVATKFITQDKVKAIVGSVTSKCTIPISDVANSNKIVMISPSATNDKVTVVDGKRKDYDFRICFIDPFQGTVGAKFALDNLKSKKAAVLYDQGNDYTVGLSNYFKDNFVKGGGEIVAFEAYGKDDKDFTAVLTNIAQKNPDLLYLPDYYQKVGLIAKQAQEKGITAKLLGGDGWDSKDLDFATLDGGYFTQGYSGDDPSPEIKTWIDQYKAKYNSTPDAFATLAYDATNVLLNAIKTANSDDPAKIREALQNTKDFPVVTGKTNFDQNGNPINKPAVILQVQKDKTYKYIATVKP